MNPSTSDVAGSTPTLHPVPPAEQPFHEVFRAELEEIRRRREACQQQLGEGTKPSTSLNLVGLAFSGGGIRSASFGLGVVQELARKGLLTSVDYLSTVSGGGYLGACLSSLLAESGAEALGPGAFPLRKEVGEPEPPALCNLRNGSNYLTPPGAFSAVSLPVLLVRGFLLTFVALLPLIACAVLATEFFYEELKPFLIRQGLHVGILQTAWPFLAALTCFTGLVVLSPFGLMLPRSWASLARRESYRKAMGAMFLLSAALLLLWPLLDLVEMEAYLTPGQILASLQGVASATLGGPPIWAGLVLALGVLGFFPAGRRLLKTFGMALAGVAGPLCLFALYLAMCAWQVNPLRKAELTERGAKMLQEDPTKLAESMYAFAADIRGGAQAATGSEPLFARLLEPTEADKPLLDDDQPLDGSRRKWIVQLGNEHLYCASDGKVLIVWGRMLDSDGYALLVLLAVVMVINFRFLNINYTSPHSFYRDRLSRVFVVKEEEGKAVSNDGLKLSELRKGREGRPSAAPYHLINTTINLGAGDPNLRGRKGSLFLFSKCYVGSEETGWCRTEEMERRDRHLDLGTAMAISGAAASPNMGLFTSRAFSFLLMLLNIRLGYWLPNPSHVRRAAASRFPRPFWGAGPRYLLKEAMGWLSARTPYVNVSDGGHLENLGVYELLRRRCKVIIAVDGEADPELRFGSMVTLMRFARIDMGISIELDLAELRKESGSSKAHWVVGEIDYGKGERGTLLYLKSTLTGDESPYVRAYRDENVAFPHESTADQFFSETQLEAYRALGEHSTDSEALRQRLDSLLGLAGAGGAREAEAGSQGMAQTG